MSLILAEEPVRRIQFSGRPDTPRGVAVVCATKEGRLEEVGRLGILARYHRRYEVDLSEHHTRLAAFVPAQRDGRFDCRAELRWQVCAPVEVVRHRVSDGRALCHDRLLAKLSRITEQFPAAESAAAEREVNSRLGAGPLVMDEGITVHHFAARLTPDAGLDQPAFGVTHPRESR
ncbi:hypothetical protein BC739_005520 [Kutzneria viridogrisea]|uniref:Uncharacterized protein n=1 Tax=Kutzneria viridogrisea TaxID=47990 RepID=A0ABR6BN13_9PSEU|nr:hypothetical protein [Kutzneria viridogrisea]